MCVGKDTDGNTILTFDSAKGFYDAENYKISLTDSNKKVVWQSTVISDYVRAAGNKTAANAGKIADGKYTVKITAYSPYAKKGGTISTQISVE